MVSVISSYGFMTFSIQAIVSCLRPSNDYAGENQKQLRSSWWSN
jgi:hypothetical protein